MSPCEQLVLLMILLLQDSYSVSIPENSPAGTFVVDVNATDDDTGDYGEVRYRITPNNAFTIDEITVRCSLHFVQLVTYML